MTDDQTTYYIAWNSLKNEGFISTDKSDVLKALGRKRIGGMEATLGAAFRECYEDQDTHIQTIKLPTKDMK